VKFSLDELSTVCPDAIIGVDNEGVINLFNAAAEKLLGFKAVDIIGAMNITTIYEEADEAKQINAMLITASHTETGRVEEYDTRIIASDGQVLSVCLTAALVHENNTVTGSVIFMHDLTSRQKLEEKLNELLRTDYLTNMFNSRQLHLSLNEEIFRSARYKHPFGLMSYSLNGIKEVNDQLGHLAGDEVLKLLALVNRDTLRENDTAYRYTGNEFLVILPETDYAGVTQVASRLQATFNKLFPEIVDLKSSHIENPVTLNIGITVFYGGNTVEANELISQAIYTMYRSKEDGDNQIVLFESDIKTVS